MSRTRRQALALRLRRDPAIVCRRHWLFWWRIFQYSYLSVHDTEHGSGCRKLWNTGIGHSGKWPLPVHHNVSWHFATYPMVRSPLSATHRRHSTKHKCVASLPHRHVSINIQCKQYSTTSLLKLGINQLQPGRRTVRVVTATWSIQMQQGTTASTCRYPMSVLHLRRNVLPTFPGLSHTALMVELLPYKH